ncbi:Oidioi.mRNA.OKI2018_I69.PAR.g12895.t1.cds [Oikopleura dioica]|uniref:Oidioi.mRNA.OKI2018_I69.PAR.g12895.t1.cds n=1 Tax=Oikopleura dioica TaxID=34765 RepID=A0ABN7S8C0_OIKDI|nr:Oidioi.mRNA.OKI2018_I69.PAR.g12895.t1.cds [Oikopleura dioica]
MSLPNRVSKYRDFLPKSPGHSDNYYGSAPLWSQSSCEKSQDTQTCPPRFYTRNPSIERRNYGSQGFSIGESSQLASAPKGRKVSEAGRPRSLPSTQQLINGKLAFTASQFTPKKDAPKKKDLRIDSWTQMTPKSSKPKAQESKKTVKDAATEMTPKKKEASVPTRKEGDVPEKIKIKEEPWPTPPPQASRATQWTPKSAGLQLNSLQRTPIRKKKVSEYFEEAKKNFGEEGSSFSMDFSESPGGTFRVHFEKKQKATILESEKNGKIKSIMKRSIKKKRVSFNSQTELIY